MKREKQKTRRKKKTHEENGDPGQADVVEGDGPLEGVLLPRLAMGVVLIPVDAGIYAVAAVLARHDVENARSGALVAVPALELARREGAARVHAAVLGKGADVILVRLLNFVVAGQGPVVVEDERVREKRSFKEKLLVLFFAFIYSVQQCGALRHEQRERERKNACGCDFRL